MSYTAQKWVGSKSVESSTVGMVSNELKKKLEMPTFKSYNQIVYLCTLILALNYDLEKKKKISNIIFFCIQA